MKCIDYKIIKILYVKALQKKILKHYYNSMYVCSVNAWVIRPGIEQQGAWFLEVAQHQLVILLL